MVNYQSMCLGYQLIWEDSAWIISWSLIKFRLLHGLPCFVCFVLLEQNEVSEVKKEETLLDLDFDPFKPETASAGSAGVTHSPMSQVSSGFYVWRCYIINFNKLSKATFALQLPLSLLNDFFLIDRYFLLGEKGIKKTLSISIILNHPPTSSH